MYLPHLNQPLDMSKLMASFDQVYNFSRAGNAPCMLLQKDERSIIFNIQAQGSAEV